MKSIGAKKMSVPIVALVLLGALAFFFYSRQASQGVVSEFGKYHGYTPQPYDGYRRLSDYMTLSDGTRVAYDLILPTKNGVPADQPLPVLFKYTPYMRTWTVYDNLGLPYRNHFQSEVQPLPAGEPVELVFDLLPTAYRFGAGKQLRITVAFADADNFDTPVLSPAPSLHLLRSAEQASCVELPLGGVE